MGFIEKIYKQAKNSKKRILLPEGKEPRVLKAVDFILKHSICEPILITGPDDYKNLDNYVSLYCEIRKHKNVKEDDARKLILENPVFYSALAVRAGDADGFVAGASTTTRDVAKAAIHCIGPLEGTKTISSSSIVILSDKTLGSNGVLVYADSGIIPDPTAEQLCDIAIASAKMAQALLDDEPRVAMLSYSTKGSGGSGKSIEKVRHATKLVMEKEPDILIDGEIQIDCAVVPEVAKRKDPNSKIKGKANVFIFPNLDAGNIAYKLTERLAKAHVIGPLLQGLKKPASDLSRGCDTQDIIDAVAVTALRAQG